MRIFARWTTRFVLAAATALSITAAGTGAAYAAEDGATTTTTAATSTAAPSKLALDNFPW